MTLSETPRAIVIDTCVLGAWLRRDRGELLERYEPMLSSLVVLVPITVVAETRFGASKDGWGAKRRAHLEQVLAQLVIAGPCRQTIDRYVGMRTWCHQTGHGLGAKHHEADRWIAATALRFGLPLVTEDRIFHGVHGLDVVTAPAA